MPFYHRTTQETSRDDIELTKILREFSKNCVIFNDVTNPELLAIINELLDFIHETMLLVGDNQKVIRNDMQIISRMHHH